MTRSQIVKNFNELYPDAKCELNYSSPYQLLVAVILSAQCTDKRVNIVTSELFKEYDTPQKMITLSNSDLEQKIHSCGFYHNKAQNILSMSKELVNKFDGQVPDDFEVLCTLAGVGRKTANVMLSEAFKKPGFAVDTHVLRVSNRLGLAHSLDPNKVELELKKFFKKKDWSRLHFQMVLFGRYKCKAKNPSCSGCPFQSICSYYKTLAKVKS